MYEKPQFEIAEFLLSADVITDSLDTEKAGDPDDWIDGGNDLD